MWQKFKIFWKLNSPEILRLLKAILKFGFNVIFPLALAGVAQAEKRGGTGPEKFNFAVDYVKSQAPSTATKAILSAVESAWMTKESEGWK